MAQQIFLSVAMAELEEVVFSDDSEEVGEEWEESRKLPIKSSVAEDPPLLACVRACLLACVLACVLLACVCLRACMCALALACFLHLRSCWHLILICRTMGSISRNAHPIFACVAGSISTSSRLGD